MPSPQQIRRQIEKLTADLVGMSLCDHQNFPSMRTCGQGICEIGIGNNCAISNTLKNVAYRNIYSELERAQAYNLRMLDGALVQMMYRFRHNEIEAYRLAFYPSPFLEEFQNNPDIYLLDEIYADVTMKNVVPFPFRFDFDCREGIAVEFDHPKSHLTLGQYRNCRIPVSAPLTPYFFISFVLNNFYHTAYQRYCEQLSTFEEIFEDTIHVREKELLHIQTPLFQKQAG